MIKIHSKMRVEGIYLNIIKTVRDKPTANVVLNGVTLKALSLRSGTRQGYSLSPLLLHIVLGVLATAIRQEEIKDSQIGKKEVKLSLFTNNMKLYLENHKDSTKIYYSTILLLNSTIRTYK